MKKLLVGMFAGFVIFSCIFTVSLAPAFADENMPSSLYDGGYVQDVLTSRQPTPWNIVKHYVGDNPKLIAFILVEGGISLSSHAKFPVGMIVRVPQKYVRRELLPSPSAAEKTLAEAEYRAESQKQSELLLTELKIKDNQIIIHWVFDALFVVVIIFLVKSKSKFVKKYDEGMSIAIQDLENAHEENRALRGEMAAKKNAETEKVWTPDTVKDALMRLTLRQVRDLLEWEALAVERQGGGESKIKLKNLSDFLKNKDENLFDVPLRLMSDHIPQSDKVARASAKKSV